MPSRTDSGLSAPAGPASMPEPSGSAPVHQRSEQHIKKVSVDQLRPGMFICDFNAGWLDHPFLFNTLLISSEAEIAEIRRHHLREVLIDTRRGLDVPQAPTLQELRSTVSSALQEQADAAQQSEAPPRKHPVAEELGRARMVLEQTASLLREALNNARLGSAVDVGALRESARRISASVIRNPSAMGLVCRLRQRDEYTFNHSLNVSVLLASFSQHLGHDLEMTQSLCLGGMLHDIGKMVVDHTVLNKPDKLTPQEFDHIKTHVVRGLLLVRDHDLPEAAIQVLLEHHERADGAGYPYGHGLPGISLAGRMASIVDIYDAISSDRCYHKGLPAPEAMRRIFEWKARFDPNLVNQFVRCLGIYPVGSLVRLSSDRLAIVIEHHPGNLMRPCVRVIYDARRKHYLPPEDIDLSAQSWQGKESITGHEDPAHWGINPKRHIGC